MCLHVNVCVYIYTHTQPPSSYLPESAIEQGSCFSNLYTHPRNRRHEHLRPRPLTAPAHSSTKSLSTLSPSSADVRAALCTARPSTAGLCPRRVCEALLLSQWTRPVHTALRCPDPGTQPCPNAPLDRQAEEPQDRRSGQTDDTGSALGASGLRGATPTRSIHL